MFTLLAPSCEGSLEDPCPFLAEEGRTEAVRPKNKTPRPESGRSFQQEKPTKPVMPLSSPKRVSKEEFLGSA